MCESSCHSCPALHRGTGPVAPLDNPSLAKGHWFCLDCCFRSTAPTLAVPCSPMPMVTSVTQMAAYQVCSHPASLCILDHVLHGNCPDVMTLGSQRRTVAIPSLAEGHRFCSDRCFRSTAPTLAVPCSPMPMVTSLRQMAAYQVKQPTYQCVHC